MNIDQVKGQHFNTKIGTNMQWDTQTNIYYNGETVTNKYKIQKHSAEFDT